MRPTEKIQQHMLTLENVLIMLIGIQILVFTNSLFIPIAQNLV